ncbi:radical SAM protein [Candidatus Woesearchaeota archaeon]|nr:radical SAM protein [Candidatus Woesearchaeota archaeon]
MQKEKGVVHINPEGNQVFNYAVNYRCNNNCVMCINNQPDLRDEISFDEIKKRFSTLDKNINYCFITGGEPTLRKDFIEMMEFLRNNFKGKIHLLTNARMFYYDDFFKKFDNLNINDKINFGIPLYGHNKDVFESISRSPGSFKQSVKGTKRLLEKGYNVEIRTIIHKLNYKHLTKVGKFILKEFPQVMHLFFGTMEFTGNGLKNKDILFVSYDKIKPYVQKTADLLEAKIEFTFNQFPLCKLSKKYWKYADHCTIVPEEHIYLKICENCRVKDKCSGIWKSYFLKGKKQEFSAVR